MAKPEIIRYHAMTPRADGIQMTRVQTLGISADKAREPVSQLGDDGVVQYIETNPTVAITIDTNNIGSTDNVQLIADALMDRTVDDPSDDPRFSGAAGDRYGDAIITAEINSVSRPVTATDILSAYVDLIVPVTEDGEDITRTCWLHRAAVTGITMTFDVNGNAAENYTLQGNNETWFMNGWKNANAFVMLDTGIGAQRATGQSFYFPHSAIPEGSSVMAVAINENIFYKSKGWQFTLVDTTLAAGTGMMGSTSGTFFNMSTPLDGTLEFASPWSSARGGDKVTVIYSRPDDTSYSWSTSGRLTSTAGSLGALARQYINIYYFNSDLNDSADASKSLRVQNISVEISPGAEDLFELGNKQAYGVVRNTPIPVTITMTVNDSDLEMWAAMAGELETGTSQVTLDDFNSNNQLIVRMYKDEARTVQTAQLAITDMEVTGARTNVSAGGNSTHEYSFLADNFTYLGSGVDPNS